MGRDAIDGKRAHPLLGVGLMLLAMALGNSLDALAKWFTQHYPVSQLVCIRFGIQALVVLALAPWIGRRAVLVTRAPLVQIGRGLAMVAASWTFVIALSMLPLSTAVVLGQTSPLIAAAIAVPLLGERVSPRHWLLVLLGFAGIVVVMRPAPEFFGWSIVLPLVSATSYAVYQVMTRRVITVDPAMPSLLYPSIIACAMAACVAPFQWIWPTPLHAALMIVHGALCGLTHLIIIRALAFSSVSIVAPFGYSGLLWGIVLGAVVFGEALDVATIVGGMLIAGSGILLAREAVLRNHAPPGNPPSSAR